MTPDNQDDRRVGTPLVPQRSYLSTAPAERSTTPIRDAAAQVARTQLDDIYNGNSRTATPHTTPVAESEATTPQAAAESVVNPYERTHTPTVTTIETDQWQKYHSAWQDYYRQYYERYYTTKVHEAKTELEKQSPQPTEAPVRSLSQAEAVNELRQDLLGKIRTQARNVRRSRHFVPLAAAAGVVVLFLFLQYNRVLISTVEAYISPGNINPANFIVDPSTDVSVGPDPKLIIPKINVDVPVVYDTAPDHDSQMKAMENGVAYFGVPGANSKPGQVGNTVLSGHSSNDILDGGNYKFIFARLEQMQVGDSIYINYGGKRYTYTVTRTKVVAPTEVSALVYPTTKPELTLITCVPLGTSLNRLLVTAEQVSPDPAAAAPAPAANTDGSSTEMPGNSPTFMQRILGN